MIQPLSDDDPHLAFLNGKHEIGKLICSINWDRTSLGSPAYWPASLKQSLSIVLNNPVPMFICWGENYTLLYNDAGRTLFGHSEHHNSFARDARSAFYEKWDTLTPALKKTMAGESSTLSNFKVEAPTGLDAEPMYFDLSCSPIINIDGVVSGVLVIATETTHKVASAQKHEDSERRLKSKDQELQLMIDILPASVVVIRGPELVVEMINRANLGYWNKTAAEVIGKPFLDILPDLADQPFAGQLRHVMATGEVIDVKESPVLFANPDGTIRETFVDYTYQPLTDSDGNRNGVLVMSFEITDRVAARKLLEQYSNELEQINQRLSITNNYLAASEARFKYLIHEAPVAIGVLHGRNMIIESANEMILRLWGKTQAIVGKTLVAALPELEGQPFLQILDDVFTSGNPYYGNEASVLLEHNGELQKHYVNFAYQPIASVGVQTTDVLVVAVDVTSQVEARKQLQYINQELASTNEELATTNEELTEIQRRYEVINRELETSSSRLRMAIESTNLGTWEYNPQTGELYWSKECRKIYGIPDSEPATYELFQAHIHPDDRAWVEGEIQKAMDPSGAGNYDLSYRIIRLDTFEPRWIKAQGAVYFDTEKALRFIGTVVDINDIKQAEEKSAKLAAIIATSNDAIIGKTLDSVITSWNSSAQRVFGYTAEEMIGQSIYKLIPPDRHDEEPKILSTLKKGERIDHFETKRLTRDGRLIDVSVTISPVMDKNGEIIGASKIARDITEKKLDEARKNDFIGMVSHELKTPLTSLGAIVQVANARLKHSGDGFLLNAMERANLQVKRMTAMINGFLNISRLESGKIHVEKQPVDLEQLIQEMIDEANLTYGTHELHFDGCNHLEVNADRDKISSVISNMISNAIKYSPKGKRIDVFCSTENNEAIFSVKDEGMGIKPNDLRKIFDRYYRVETNHTRYISGFGIGLYLSKEIIERHNGRVWAESQSGIGSTFYFALPLE